VLQTIRVDNDPVAPSLELAKAGPDPEVVLEATYGWYRAADLLKACGARVHLAHPLGVKTFGYQRARDRRPRLEKPRRAAAHAPASQRPGWPPPAVRELRELVRYRAKLVALRSGPKAQVHAVLATQGVRVPMSEVFGVAGTRLPRPAPPWTRPTRCGSPRCGASWSPTTRRSRCSGGRSPPRRGGEVGYPAVQATPRGRGRCWRGVFVAEVGDVHRFTGAPQPCSWAGPTPHHHESDTTVPRRPDHQTGPPTGALGRGRGHRAAPRGKQAGRLLPPHRRPARHRHHPASPPPASC
jgi:hypothetical protein